METIVEYFISMIETLAVMLVVALFLGSGKLYSKFFGEKRSIKFSIIAGLFGGLLAVYGNLAALKTSGGALVSVRDMGPMIAGFAGGPVGGVIAGIIAGVHRFTMGGVTVYACMVATFLIGLACGLISKFSKLKQMKPWHSLLIGAGMELFHLGMVLLIVRPFETAVQVVREMIIPFVLINAAGFTMMIAFINYMEKQRALQAERSKLQSELHVASTIQHSLLPKLSDTYPGRDELDVYATMIPAKAVGGDFYDVFFVDNNRIAFLIGDVSGKGIPAALFMANAKTVLQNCIRDLPDLTSALCKANDVLCEGNDAEMFVTIWVGILNIETGELKFSSCGHNPPVHISGNNAEFIRIKSGFVMAGMEDVMYKENTWQLKKGDTILLYTDGVVEAETKNHELYGEERLLSCLTSLKDAKAETVVNEVKQSVDNFIDGNDQFDDLTMLCIKYK